MDKVVLQHEDLSEYLNLSENVPIRSKILWLCDVQTQFVKKNIKVICKRESKIVMIKQTKYSKINYAPIR